ncbi:MAG: F0F1 ATP synthase subunit delta [bacterium]|nr:F0F1 ATP synthase subunit delta [bacterium]
MKKSIFPGVMTYAEARDWRTRLNDIKDEIFHQTKKGKLEFSSAQANDLLMKHIPQNEFENWYDFFVNQHDDFQKEIDLVIKYLEGYERCEITVARQMSKAAHERVVNWFKSQNILKVILEIKVDDSVGGGALIALGGKIYDYSLKKKIAVEVETS